MKKYYRVRLGQKGKYAEEAFKGNFIGVDFGLDMDLSNELNEDWREFNKKFIPVYLSKWPHKTKIAAGLSCGFVWTVSKGISIGDIVLSPNSNGNYFVGEVISGYSYHPGQILPHRRSIKWFPKEIERSKMSKELQGSTGTPGTVSDISDYANEIENLISGNKIPDLVSNDEDVEDPTIFALEKHLEDFLVQNWKNIEVFNNYDILEEDGEIVGQQFKCDNDYIDILALSKDKKEYLVIELKKGRASDKVVGQIQRYMGYIMEEYADAGQRVKGIIIALEDDLKLRRALKVTNNIEFYRYQVSFKLFKG